MTGISLHFKGFPLFPATVSELIEILPVKSREQKTVLFLPPSREEPGSGAGWLCVFLSAASDLQGARSVRRLHFLQGVSRSQILVRKHQCSQQQEEGHLLFTVNTQSPSGTLECPPASTLMSLPAQPTLATGGIFTKQALSREALAQNLPYLSLRQ